MAENRGKNEVRIWNGSRVGLLLVILGFMVFFGLGPDQSRFATAVFLGAVIIGFLLVLFTPSDRKPLEGTGRVHIVHVNHVSVGDSILIISEP